jgi:hypothetical protein
MDEHFAQAEEMEERTAASKKPVWLSGLIHETKIFKFMDFVNAKTGLALKT